MNWLTGKGPPVYGAAKTGRSRREIAQMRKRLEREAEEQWKLAALVAESQKRKAKR